MLKAYFKIAGNVAFCNSFSKLLNKTKDYSEPSPSMTNIYVRGEKDTIMKKDDVKIN